MDTLIQDRPHWLESTEDRPDLFLFMSGYQCIKGQGIAERITEPAAGSADPDSPLQQAIKEAMARAVRNGEENPIVCGAIPFDVDQPSCLIVPEKYRPVARVSMPKFLTDPAAGPLHIRSYKSTPDQRGFTHAVDEARNCFRRGELNKAVLSRILDIETDQQVSANKVLHNLMVQNPSATHFRLPLDEERVLVGASPELLLRKDGARFTSNPLAGSAARGLTPEKDEEQQNSLLQSLKDHYEHQLVVEQMKAQLKPVCSSLAVPMRPSLIHTPTMWHLSTEISGELNNSIENALQAACLLHPTPAMCGAPTPEARDLIRRLEPHDREFFSGMVGWTDSQGNGEWVLVIRSGIVAGSRIRLFAGAGVVEDSRPVAEWAETHAKMGTMLNAFGLSSSEVI